MFHPTFRKLFYGLALIALAVSLVWPSGVARANHDPSCQLGNSLDPWWWDLGCNVDHSAGSGTTTTTTSPDPDTDGDGVPDSSDKCPKDKNAVPDSKGKCPSDETGQRNSSPGSLQGFNQNGTGIQDLYTPYGRQVASLDPSLLQNFASTPPGTTIVLPAMYGQSYMLTNGGNGSFTGTYEGGGFNFYRPDLVKKPVCDPDALAEAKARLDAARALADAAQARADAALSRANDAHIRANDARALADAAQARAEDAANVAKVAANAARGPANAAALAANAAFAAQADANAAQAAADAAQAVYDSLKENCP